MANNEYENRLFVTDVGSQFIEELHEIDYEKQYQNGNQNHYLLDGLF